MPSLNEVRPSPKALIFECIAGSRAYGTEFSKLMSRSWVSAAERDWIDSLLIKKAAAIEVEPIAMAAERVDALQLEIERYKSAESLVSVSSRRSGTGELDELLRYWISYRQIVA